MTRSDRNSLLFFVSIVKKDFVPLRKEQALEGPQDFFAYEPLWNVCTNAVIGNTMVARAMRKMRLGC